MPAIVLNAFQRITFFVSKYEQAYIGKAKATPKDPSKQTGDAAYLKLDIVKCKCCNWQGKSSETKQEFLFLPYATELELFCPKCNRYLCFISGKDN